MIPEILWDWPREEYELPSFIKLKDEGIVRAEEEFIKGSLFIALFDKSFILVITLLKLIIKLYGWYREKQLPVICILEMEIEEVHSDLLGIFELELNLIVGWAGSS